MAQGKKKKFNKESNFILVISDFYYEDSAKNLMEELIKKTKMSNFSVKRINDNLLKLFKSTKLKLSNPYNDEFTVFVSVSIDNLKEFSKLKLSRVKILDRTNMPIMNEIKTKKDIFESLSSIFVSERNKFLSKIFFGFTNL